MDRLTFDGRFCDIAQCTETPGGSFCESGYCSQREVWERLKQYEDTDYMPDEITKLQGGLLQRNAELLKAREDAQAMRNELCGRCGAYLYEHNGACDGCRWREK